MIDSTEKNPGLQIPEADVDLTAAMSRGINEESLVTLAHLSEVEDGLPIFENAKERSGVDLTDRLREGGSIPLNEFAIESFKKINMPPRHREYLDSLSGITLSSNRQERTLDLMLYEGQDPDEAIAKEFKNNETVINYTITESPDGTIRLVVTYADQVLQLSDEHGDNYDLLDFLEGKSALTLFSESKSVSHIKSDLLDGILTGIRDYLQIKKGIDAESWLKKLMDDRGNCIDTTLFKLIVLQLYPKFDSRFRQLVPLGYTGNSMMSGGEGFTQHYGLAYLDQHNRFILMPAGGSPISAKEVKNIRSLVPSKTLTNNRSLTAKHNSDVNEDSALMKGRQLKAQVIHMAREARKYFPEQASEFLQEMKVKYDYKLWM